jgi:hypothetical protein
MAGRLKQGSAEWAHIEFLGVSHCIPMPIAHTSIRWETKKDFAAKEPIHV